MKKMEKMKNNLPTLPPYLDEALIGFLLGDGGVFYAAKRSL